MQLLYYFLRGLEQGTSFNMAEKLPLLETDHFTFLFQIRTHTSVRNSHASQHVIQVYRHAMVSYLKTILMSLILTRGNTRLLLAEVA